MKRIALLVCGMLLLLSNTAEARLRRWTRTTNYPAYNTTAQPAPAAVAPASYTENSTAARESASTETTSTEATSAEATATEAAPADATSAEAASAETTSATTTSAATTAINYSTRTAQGVANLMASYNRVGHWGGNPGYEGCGCGATPQAAYSICCYANSGMATVDVGYARSANGMWYCCRRYR